MICQHLRDRGIRAVLTGGAVVSIYSDSRYLTADLDFITLRDIRDVQHAMSEIGFLRSTGRYFTHSDTDIVVEFPPGPLAIGDSPVSSTGTVTICNMELELLTPTQCVMDRLAAYYHWDDEQALMQALLVSSLNEIDFDQIQHWSLNEGMLNKYEHFLSQLDYK
jgi:hypothetical protein